MVLRNIAVPALIGLLSSTPAFGQELSLSEGRALQALRDEVSEAVREGPGYLSEDGRIVPYTDERVAQFLTESQEGLTRARAEYRVAHAELDNARLDLTLCTTVEGADCQEEGLAYQSLSNRAQLAEATLGLYAIHTSAWEVETTLREISNEINYEDPIAIELTRPESQEHPQGNRGQIRELVSLVREHRRKEPQITRDTVCTDATMLVLENPVHREQADEGLLQACTILVDDLGYIQGVNPRPSYIIEGMIQ